MLGTLFFLEILHVSYINSNEKELRPLSDQSCLSPFFSFLVILQVGYMKSNEKELKSMTDQITVSILFARMNIAHL